MTCLNHRPVIYILYSENDVKAFWRASLNQLRKCLDAIRGGARSLALGEPYFVLMTPPPARAENVREAIGADAISVYAGPIPDGPHLPFSALQATTQQYWDRELDAAPSGVVPTVMIGWDTRHAQRASAVLGKGDESRGWIGELCDPLYASGVSGRMQSRRLLYQVSPDCLRFTVGADLCLGRE